jgi:hypothetical protein
MIWCRRRSRHVAEGELGRARRLNRRVKGQKIRLVRDARNQTDHLVDARFGQLQNLSTT